nr:MAG TPA: hypothetical protein [Caudoviricetes sp.]
MLHRNNQQSLAIQQYVAQNLFATLRHLKKYTQFFEQQASVFHRSFYIVL